MKLFAGRTLRRFTETPREREAGDYSGDEAGQATPTEVVTNPGVADLVTSVVQTRRLIGHGARHKPVIDLDVPATLVPSATPGHSHLYIDVAMTWDQYERLLEALVACRIVEAGYLGASRERGYTAVRVPWKPKGVEVPSQARFTVDGDGVAVATW